jgi:hypothetical protein
MGVEKTDTGAKTSASKLVIDVLNRGILGVGDTGVLASLLGETITGRSSLFRRKCICRGICLGCNANCPPCTDAITAFNLDDLDDNDLNSND